MDDTEWPLVRSLLLGCCLHCSISIFSSLNLSLINDDGTGIVSKARHDTLWPQSHPAFSTLLTAQCWLPPVASSALLQLVLADTILAHGTHTRQRKGPGLGRDT